MSRVKQSVRNMMKYFGFKRRRSHSTEKTAAENEFEGNFLWFSLT